MRIVSCYGRRAKVRSNRYWASALQCFGEGGVNLTRLDSRPMRDRPWQYRFYVDIEIADPEAAARSLAALVAETTEVKLFGTYPAAVGPAPGPA